MPRKLKIYLMGGDRSGWALDTDLRLARQALTGIVEFVGDPASADLIHTVWPEEILEDPSLRPLQTGKPLLACFANDPFASFEQVPGLYQAARGWYCVGQSHQATQRLRSLGIPFVRHVPYIADLQAFRPIESCHPDLDNLRRTLNLPTGKLLIGSFQRDSLGSDRLRLKPQKGADVFVGLLVGLAKRIGIGRIHVVLAGPRRHWLRAELRRLGLSFTFDGESISGDDYPTNILSAERINKLTNLVDVYVVPSRWEGGPRAVLESAACRCAIICTDVGLAPDVVHPDCIYRSLSEGIELLAKHDESRFLDQFLDVHLERLQAHSIRSVADAWRAVYEEVGATLCAKQATHPPAEAPRRLPKRPGGPVSTLMLGLSRMRKRFERKGTINIWGEMVPGPYGGGSQALKAVAAELGRRGYRIVNNAYHESDAHLLNSAWFDVEKARSTIRSSPAKPPVIHRIDGPIAKYRGKDLELDLQIFDLNREVATVTAFQSVYSWKACRDLGFEPVNPMIVRNACDPRLFSRTDRRQLDAGEKIRLISSSWSMNLNKGFATYEFLDAHLDFSRFEYRFVGRSPVSFTNIAVIDAVPSDRMGRLLRDSDIYITASLHDPASNALLEAINCGLPCVYADSGGHAELAWYSGLPFREPQEIPELLDLIAKDYDSYRVCTYSRTISEVVDSYLRAIRWI